MHINEFDYEFPQELIAKRSAGKGKTNILHVPRHQPHKRHIIPATSLVDLITPQDCLVVNNTKVISARLLGHKPTGGKVEILLIRPSHCQNEQHTCWEAWVKPGRHFSVGATFLFDTVTCTVQSILEDGSRVLDFATDASGMQALMQNHGKVPLPPYINRESDEQDKQDYQTIFAKHEGAVAAPTASLHFSEDMLAKLQQKGTAIAEITLHVGPGTFQNIKTQTVQEHTMHSEEYELTPVNAAIINKCKQAGGKIISVGTTSTRVLETLSNQDGLVTAAKGSTDVFIYPGYQWKCVDALLTNFHWPRSTLVMLVASFLGKESTLQCYEYAIENKMKLFSYGDGMFIS